MSMRGLLVAVTTLGLMASCNSKSLKPGYCNTNTDCTSPKICDNGSNGTFMCIGNDGGTAGAGGKSDGGAGKGGSGGSGGAGGSGGNGGHPFRCDASTQCSALNDGAAPVCEIDGASCVECVADTNCTDTKKPICGTGHTCGPCTIGAVNQCASHTGKTVCLGTGTCAECATNADCKTATSPICGTDNQCHPCLSDSDCTAAPNVCMTDGHCAGTGEVLFVHYSSSGCPAPTGSSSNPYCDPNMAVSQLAGSTSVVIIVGAANNQVTLNTGAVSSVVIGRKDSTGNVGSIPAIASTALTVSAGTVLIRDLTVNAGTTSASKGILATGASTKVTLLRVTASLGTGLGIDAESGAEIHMDRVLVQNNSAGGAVVGSAKYEIVNSILATNSYGIQFSATATPVAGGMGFAFDTVVSNTGNSATCDPNMQQTLQNSIVVGAVANCMLLDTSTTAPSFSSTNPYHLTAKAPCPNGDPSTFPPDDFDGDVRTKPLDCGADQYVAP